KVEDRDGAPLVDKIVDSAGQKGTGKWTAMDALELGVPLTLIAEAVSSRFLSARVAERARASEAFGRAPARIGAGLELVGDIADAVYAAKIVSYAQGFMLLRDAASAFGWTLSYGDIAALWRGGCIIRSRFLGDIRAAFDADSALPSLLLAPF